MIRRQTWSWSGTTSRPIRGPDALSKSRRCFGEADKVHYGAHGDIVMASVEALLRKNVLMARRAGNRHNNDMEEKRMCGVTRKEGAREGPQGSTETLGVSRRTWNPS